MLKELASLFIAFFKIGLFTFGGGYAMIPMLEREIVKNHNWATEEELMDYYAIGQCTPGIIAVNTATFVGHKRKGIIGAIAATLGVITPSVIIILIIATVLNKFQNLEVVKHAFNGIRAAVVALVLASVIKLVKKAVVDIPTLVIAALVLGLGLWLDLSPIIFVVCSGAAGIFVKYFKGRAK